MGTRIKRRKRIGKVLVFLLASCSLLGISPLTATAAPPPGTDFEIIVEVTDSTPDDCTPIPDPASWSPALFTSVPISEDLFSPSVTPTFTVNLNFYTGSDMMCGVTYPVTGTLGTSWVSTTTPPLALASLSCQIPTTCLPVEFAPAGAGGQVIGEYIVPEIEGTYSGTLTITWTPDV